MKKVVTVQEVDGEGLESLLDKPIQVFCASFIYAGTLKGINTTCILLEDAKIVYDTGAQTSVGYTTAEHLPQKKHYIMLGMIESFGPGK